MLLATARLLAARREELRGEVRFVFQHAEELLPGGARDLVAAGVMDGVDAVVGCPLMAPLEPGKIAVLTGPAMAAADMFALTIVGKGGHGAFPHTAIDPIAVSAQVISSLQHIVSRNTNPLDSVVVSVTRIAGGTADNIIPMSVELGGTVRMFTKEHREQTRAAMERVIRGVTEAHGATYELDYTVGYDPVVNDAAIAAVVSDAVRETLGKDGLASMDPIMGGDDFSAYQAKAPGVYFMVGAGGPDAMPHHHPRFTVDEGAMTGAVEVFVRTALTLLART
jgi:amidohydrolase